MKLVAMRCEFCGGKVERATLDTAICVFCDMGYLIDRGPVYVQAQVPVSVEEPLVPEVAEEPEPACELQTEEEFLRDLMVAEKADFVRKMHAAGVIQVDGRWQVKLPELLLLPTFVGLAGMVLCALLAVAVPSKYTLLMFGIGAFKLVAGGLYSLSQFTQSRQLVDEIDRFGCRRSELRKTLREVRQEQREAA